MKHTTTRPTHITSGDVLDDLGLSRSEASTLKFKATILDAILLEIERKGYTRRQLVEILDEYQPSVSNLIRGKIGKLSLEKPLYYSDRLRIKTTLTIGAASSAPRQTSRRPARHAGSPKRPTLLQPRRRRRATIG